MQRHANRILYAVVPFALNQVGTLLNDRDLIKFGRMDEGRHVMVDTIAERLHLIFLLLMKYRIRSLPKSTQCLIEGALPQRQLKLRLARIELHLHVVENGCEDLQLRPTAECKQIILHTAK